MKKDRKTTIWIVLFAVLLGLGAGGLFLARRNALPGAVARVSVDGVCREVIDLRAVTLPYTLQIETEWGSNTLRVEHGRIAVIEADCPDQICVHQGFVGETGIPIVCLPHRLVIELEDGE